MKPVIAISLGDPGGVGAEVVIKALATGQLADECAQIIVGNAEVLGRTAQQLGLPMPDCEIVDPAPELSGRFETGGVCAVNGEASVRYIRAATELVLNGRAAALCTAPISKEAIRLAGVDFPGHTEMLADMCGVKEVRMMLVGGGLRAVLQTIHVALKDVPALLTRTGILDSLRIIHEFALRTGGDRPRIAVCGLNPHAGEGGHFGTEEIDTIAPAIGDAVNEGINASGPLPGDTVFFRTREGEFDYVLAMYHDQALIPVKTLDFHSGVNVTLGLPIVRTSPDHGTAFNLAGKGVANEGSMVAALKFAASLATQRGSGK